MEQHPNLADKVLGAMVGSALGDAIGELAFAHPGDRALEQAVAGSDVLRYTDDTAMAIGLAEELAAHGDIDPESLGRRFHRNYLGEPWRGYGSGPPALFAMVAREGLGYGAAARRLFGGQGSFGNGAAMRVAPVGLFFPDMASVAAGARASAAVTHAHPVGIDGAAIQALAVAQARARDPRPPFSAEAFLAPLIDAAETVEMRACLERVRALVLERAPPARAAAVIGRSVLVTESMPYALYAFLTRPDSFRDCLFRAVLCGGDRDTLGAMAGAISGAHLGIDAIPAPWRRRLENRAAIEGLARALVGPGASGPGRGPGA